MQFIIVDLEATCWKTGTYLQKMEVIEIGAVRLDENLVEAGEFAAFVKPTREPVLSDFCRQLTGITQEQVDGAEQFPAVFEKFCAWIGEGEFRLCSWGAYDFNQFELECRRYAIPFPFVVDRHINIKRLFASQRNLKPCSMKQALNLLQIPLEGRHHRGIDDAKNIAKIARTVLVGQG